MGMACKWYAGGEHTTTFTQTPGHNHLTGKTDYPQQEILNDHCYCSYDESKKEICYEKTKKQIEMRVTEAKEKFDSGFIITEFGSCGNTKGCADEITNTTTN